MNRNSKRWLEPKGDADSSITWTVKTFRKKGVVMQVEATMTLADCNRKIDWSFDVRSEKDAKRMLAKAARAHREMYAFECALAAAAAEFRKTAGLRRQVVNAERKALRRRYPPSR